MPKWLIVFLIILVMALLVKYWPYVLGIVSLIALYYIIRYIKKERYFKSDEFLKQKKVVSDTVKDFNEISEYVKNIPNNNHFVSADNTYKYSHLAKTENTSKHNYKRDRNVRTLGDKYVYSTSLNVVQRASEQPIKYLCKYFNINSTEKDFEQLEEIGENISRLENTINNLNLRKEKIKKDFKPPAFILKYYKEELMKRLDMNIPEINIEYVEYVFKYVSPGGNSSQRTTITFDGKTVEATAKYISERVTSKKSTKAQRTLMTEKLRNQIKERDNYTCQMCSASTKEQSLLLLEIDHIIPVSKGGLSTPDNLQTLCWKCNRTKGNKILS